MNWIKIEDELPKLREPILVYAPFPQAKMAVNVYICWRVNNSEYVVKDTSLLIIDSRTATH